MMQGRTVEAQAVWVAWLSPHSKKMLQQLASCYFSKEQAVSSS